MKDLHRSGDPFKHADYLEYKEFYDDSIVRLPGAFFSSAGDLVLPVENFGQFPWIIDDTSDQSLPTISGGGHPLYDYEWTLCKWVETKDKVAHPLCRQYRWIIPKGLVVIIESRYKQGRIDLQSELRNLIGAAYRG